MTHTVARESLLRAVKLATSISPRNSVKTALKGLLLKAGKNQLSVQSTDMEMAGIQINVTADGEGHWEALPDAGRLASVLSEANCQSLELSKENDSLFLTAGFAETVLLDCARPDEYPSTTWADAKTSIVIPAEVLAKALRRVVNYCSDVSARYALTGVKFERMDGELILVATDGKQMGVQTVPCPGCEASSESQVVPEKAIRTLLASMRGEDGEVTIGFDSNYITFAVDGITLQARLVEGRYPTWREVFPKKHDHKIPLNSATLLAVTRQACTMCTEDSRGVDYAFEDSKLTVRSSDPVAGKATITLPIAYAGKGHRLRFDGSLVAGMLMPWDGDTELEACLVGNNTVAEFRFPDDFRAVLVPLSKAGE